MSKVKVITGGIQKLSRAKQAYLAAVLVLFVSTIGYSVQGYLQLREFKAQAAGYTPLVLQPYAVISVCKRYVNTPFGGMHKVGVIAQRAPSTDTAITGLQARTFRGEDGGHQQGRVVDSGTNIKWLGAYTGVTTYASAYYKDTVELRLKRDGVWTPMIVFTPATRSLATCP